MERVKKHAYSISVLIGLGLIMIPGLGAGGFFGGEMLIVGASVLRIIYFFVKRGREPEKESFKNLLVPVGFLLLFIGFIFLAMAQAIHTSGVAGLSVEERYSRAKEMRVCRTIFTLTVYSALGLFLYWASWRTGILARIDAFLDRKGVGQGDSSENNGEGDACPGCGDAGEREKAA